MVHTFEAADGIQAIDANMFGRDRLTSAYLIAADEPAIVETGPTTSVDAVQRGLSSLGIDAGDLAHIVVTHIHLDHAGGAGALAGRYPNADVWVHERGAPHLADPARLVDSAGRIYGPERLLELFGPVHPVPGERLRAMHDGDRISLGNRTLDVLYTPGHAGHHVALVDDRTRSTFVGDAMGIFLPDVRVLRPATPPPEFDLELAVESVERIRAAGPSAILFSHFGPDREVDELCDLAIDRLRQWTSIVEDALRTTDDLPGVVLRLRSETERSDVADDSGDDRVRYEFLSSYEMNASGLVRYLRRSGAVEASRPAER
ncbi:MAG TPA: MBL fold metallo-hydrolase [Actinomycetota bacterium]|nr:MBL fold metallo-hydrolase [Actinomycetota bacterium]